MSWVPLPPGLVASPRAGGAALRSGCGGSCPARSSPPSRGWRRRLDCAPPPAGAPGLRALRPWPAPRSPARRRPPRPAGRPCLVGSFGPCSPPLAGSPAPAAGPPLGGLWLCVSGLSGRAGPLGPRFGRSAPLRGPAPALGPLARRGLLAASVLISCGPSASVPAAGPPSHKSP